MWKCRACGHHFTLRYPKWVSGYAQCPQCHHRTKSSTEEVINPATTISSGSSHAVETCAFCTFRRETRRFFRNSNRAARRQAARQAVLQAAGPGVLAAATRVVAEPAGVTKTRLGNRLP